MSIINRVLKFLFSVTVKCSPVLASKAIYYKSFRKKLDLKNPQTFNEKLMWLKLYEDDTLKVQCTDKYAVRDYVEQFGYADILIDLYKVYNSIEDINFDELPQSFVMKCTHGSGFNIISSSKDKLNSEQTRDQLNKWMKMDYAQVAAETHYSKIKPRIIVERFLGDVAQGKIPIDYKIHCFHGDPKIIEVVLNRGTVAQKHIMMNRDWLPLPYNEDSIKLNKVVKKPEKLEEMLKISHILSGSFTYVRVDLYFCENKVYFGELTFTPAACLDKVDLNNTADYQIGQLLDLNSLRKSTLTKKLIPPIKIK